MLSMHRVRILGCVSERCHLLPPSLETFFKVVADPLVCTLYENPVAFENDRHALFLNCNFCEDVGDPRVCTFTGRSADFMRTVTDAEDDMQLFWQAFPAQGGAARTTYMFTYADCAKQRPPLQVMHSPLRARPLFAPLPCESRCFHV